MSASVASDIVTASRVLVAQGVLDAFGHVSQRDPDEPGQFWLSTAAGSLRELVFMAIHSAREAEHFLRAAAFAPPVPLSAGELALTRRPKPAAIDRGWENWVAALGSAGRGASA